mgnify:CR=1 FL=1|jgi:hypothetical protein
MKQPNATRRASKPKETCLGELRKICCFIVVCGDCGQFLVVERLQMKSLFQDSFRHVFLVRGEANWFGHCPCRVSWGLGLCRAVPAAGLAYHCDRVGGGMFGGVSGFPLSLFSLVDFARL